MKDQILKIAKVKSEKEFYKKFPTEEAFMAKHGKQLKKAAMGKAMVARQLTQLTDFANPPQAEVGTYIGGDTYQNAAFKYGNFADEADASVTGNAAPIKVQNVQPPAAGAQQSPYAFDAGTTGMKNINWESVGEDALPELMEMQGGGRVSAQPMRTSPTTPTANMNNIGNMLGNQQFQQKAINQATAMTPSPSMMGGSPSFGSKLGSGLINNAGSLIQGINMLKDEKQQKQIAKQSAALTGVVGKAVGLRSEISKRKYVTQYDTSVQPGELGNPYGEGTTPLVMQYGGSMIPTSREANDALRKEYNEFYASRVPYLKDDGYDEFYRYKVKDLKQVPRSQGSGWLLKDGDNEMFEPSEKGEPMPKHLQKKKGTKTFVEDYVQMEDNPMMRYYSNSILNLVRENAKNKYSMLPSYQTFQDGGDIGGNPTEIQNTFAPNVIYTNLEYEPLNDSNVKQFKKGGKLKKAQIGAGVAGQLGGGVGSLLGGGKFNQAGGAGKIGSTLGGIAGSFIPGVGTVIGSAVGGLIGGAIGGKSANSTAKLQEEAQNNMMGSALQQGAQSIQSNYSGFMEDGGWVSNDWQPQVIATFGEHKLKDLLKPPHDAQMLRAGGHLKEYTPPSERAMETYDMGGELETHWGGYMEPMSQNPYLPDGGVTVMPRGQSHAESDGKGNTGIGITFGDNPVEVERGEPMVKLKDGGTGEDNLVVFGNMKIPNYATDEFDKKAKGKKFKTYATDLTKTEAKQSKLIDKSVDKLDDLELLTPFDKLELDSLQANIIGANMKLKDIADKKQKLGDLQQSIHATAPEFGYEDVDKFNKDVMKGSVKIKKGKVNSDVPEAQNGIVTALNAPTPLNIPNNASSSWYETPQLINLKGVNRENPIQKLIKSIVPQQPVAKFPLRQGFGYNPPVNAYQNVPAINYNVGAGIPTVTALDAPTPLGIPNTGSPNFQPTGTRLPAPELTLDVKDGRGILGTVGDFINENLKDNGSTLVSQLLPYLRPTNQIPLDPTQLAGEMYALANNQLEPVFAQTVQPRLGSPIDISLQSSLNANQADYNALLRNVGYNPAAQSLLAAQKYAANSEVLGKESQLNKEEKARVYDQNRQLLNEYDLKNLAISDTQQVRQAQAKSNTKAQAAEAYKSIGDKYLQNQRENREAGIYENLYNFRYDRLGRAINMNPLAQFAIPNIANQQPGQVAATTTTASADLLPIYDASGKTITGYKQKAKNGNIVKAIKNL